MLSNQAVSVTRGSPWLISALLLYVNGFLESPKVVLAQTSVPAQRNSGFTCYITALGCNKIVTG